MSRENEQAERINILREKCRQMTIEELQALAAAFKRHTGNLAEELRVLQDALAARLGSVAALERRHYLNEAPRRFSRY